MSQAVRKVNGVSTKEYTAWKAMKDRCYGKSNSSTKYQINGILVCEKWKSSYEEFFQDMGPAPSPLHSLDRIDNLGNYEPANCKWSTRSEQNNNKSSNVCYTKDGKTQSLKQWCDELCLDYRKVKSRINTLGYGFEQAILEQDRPKHTRYTFDGKTLTLIEWSRMLGIDYQKMHHHTIRKGKDVLEFIAQHHNQ